MFDMAVEMDVANKADGGVLDDSDGGAQPEKKPVKVRSNFPETWIWAERIAG